MVEKECGRPRKSIKNETQAKIREQWRRASAKYRKKKKLLKEKRLHSNMNEDSLQSNR